MAFCHLGLRVALLRRTYAQTNVFKNPVSGYGLTETSPVTHANPYNNHKYETIGVAVPNIEFKVSFIS